MTVTVARRVAPGREDEFEQWSAELTRRAAHFPGFLGAGLLRPGHVGEAWHVVFRFDSPAHWEAWERSAVRVEHLDVGDAIAIHPTGVLGLVYDHRAFDGSTASMFLMHIRDSLEKRDWEAEVG